MRKVVTMNLIIFFIYASQVLLIFGKLTILRESLLSKTVRDKVKIICVSEDDGSALVWNYDFYKHSDIENFDLDFRSNSNQYENNEINCKMNREEGCLKLWTKHNWNLTNSFKTPMAPVFDQRWEEFTEFKLYINSYKYIHFNITTNITFSFSVRASKDVRVLICYDYEKIFCYWITIGGWENQLSVIRKCTREKPESQEWLIKNVRCREELDSIDHEPLSESEWRSFTIAWNIATKNITVYDTHKIILSYVDKEEYELLDKNYNIFIGNNDVVMFVRLHKYDFLHTTVENATLTSPVFQLNDRICVQLLIGLCFECDANIILRDSTNFEVLETITVKGSSKITIHGLPTWQYVKIEKNTTDHIHKMIIQVIPKLNNYSLNPLWAIANVRQCPQHGALRKGVTFPSYWPNKVKYLSPSGTCQKLFYDEHTVINPILPFKRDIILDDINCNERKIGPHCSFSCEYDLNSKGDCKGIKICYENGCTCASGFSGDNCAEPCELNTYGHNCKKACGSCRKRSFKDSCNIVTGLCTNGCDNTKAVYIPPLCQTRVNKPKTPVITFVTKTTIWSLVSIIWKNDYDETSIFYFFTIKEQTMNYVQSRKRLFRNMTYLIGYFDQLKPATTYQIRCTLYIANDIQIHSDWKSAKTECIPNENFDIIPEENSLTIDWRFNISKSYICLAPSYYLVIQNTDIDKTLVSESVTSFPYKLQRLPSYTFFNVTISYKNYVLFFQKTHTLGIPSKIFDLQSLFIPIILLIIVIVILLYVYRRKKQKKIKKTIQDDIALSIKINTCEEDTKLMILNSKENLSILFDKSLSQASTSKESPFVNTEEDKKMTSLIKVKDFESYFKNAIKSGLLDKQYEMLPKKRNRSWDYGNLAQNKYKNRNKNLIAYDETRVILKKLPDDDYSDYINANYISGYKKEKYYIATQGPKSNTVNDFWRMIWQENVLIICMLTNVTENGHAMCEQYWPDINEKKEYGDITVLNAKHDIFAVYCVRTFKVTYREETRQIEHLHYMAWLDNGVPMYMHSVITYLKKLLPGDGPVVVHCNDGIGRTGIIILCDVCIHQAKAEELIDIFAVTSSLRKERANMINSKQQYLLAHLILAEYSLSITTALPHDETLVTRIKDLKEQLSIQQEKMRNTEWQNDVLQQIASSSLLLEYTRSKNKFSKLILDKVKKMSFFKKSINLANIDYTYIDGIKHQNQYLIIQISKPSILNQFWQIIDEFKVKLILMLQSSDFQNASSSVIISSNNEFKSTPHLNITVKATVKEEYYTSQELLLVDSSKESSVTILYLTEWESGEDQLLPSVMAMMTFSQAAEKIAKNDKPILLCHDNIKACGLYLALSFLLEQMAIENECDVCLAMRTIRQSISDFEYSSKHLEYLYDAVTTYIEHFKTDENFS